MTTIMKPANNKTAAPSTNSTAIALRSVPINGIEDVMRIADVMFKAGCVPQGVGKPEGAAAIILLGLEVGLSPGQALQTIKIVNGRASMWGDAILALVRRSGLLQRLEERIEGEGDARQGVCIVHRKGEESEKLFAFSMADAKRAKLADKKGPWQEYPDRMLLMRARGFALRDKFTDVLCGMLPTEEVEDYSNGPGPRVEVVAPQQTPATETPPGPTTAAASSSPAETTPVDGELMSTEEQHKEIARLQDRFMLHVWNVSRTDAGIFRAAWLRTLARWSVDSARKLTQAHADELLGLMRTPEEKLTEDMRKFF